MGYFRRIPIIYYFIMFDLSYFISFDWSLMLCNLFLKYRCRTSLGFTPSKEIKAIMDFLGMLKTDWVDKTSFYILHFVIRNNKP